MTKYKIDSTVMNIYNKAVMNGDDELQRNCIKQIEEAVSHKIEENKSLTAWTYAIAFMFVGVILKIVGVL